MKGVAAISLLTTSKLQNPFLTVKYIQIQIYTDFRLLRYLRRYKLQLQPPMPNHNWLFSESLTFEGTQTNNLTCSQM